VLPLDLLPLNDGLGGLDDGSQIGFRLADDAAEDTAHVEPQQGQPECTGSSLGGQRLASAGDADDQQSLGRWESIGFCRFTEGTGAACEPVLEVVEAADVVEGRRSFHDFDQAVLLQGAGFLAGDDFGIDAFGFDDGQGERIFSLSGGEAECALQRTLPDDFGHVFQLGRIDDAVEDGAELGGTGQTEIDVRDFVIEFGWQLEATA